MKRFFKKLAYGLFYLFIFGGVGYGVYLYMYAEPAPSCFDNMQNQDEAGVDCDGGCVPCELKSISIKEGESMAFPLTDTTSSLAVRIDNPSLNYGLERFDYSIEVFSKFGGPRIVFVTGSSSLYPGESKYVVEPALDVVYGDIGAIEFNVLSSDWQEASVLSKKPNIVLSSDKILLESIVPRGFEIKGAVVNNSDGSYNLRVLAFGKNRLGEIIGLSTSLVNNLRGGENRLFSVFLPQAGYSSVDLSYEVLVD